MRRREDRGRWFGTEEQRLAILREAIIAGAEYVDLEDDVAAEIPRFGSTKRIVSHHNFDETPMELFDIHKRMAKCDPDVIKIVTMANSPSDNVRMLELVQSATIPTVGFCMGEFGTISRILCGRFGSPFTYAAFSREREMAPGQLTFAETRNLYRFNKITKDTQIFGVIGDPIAHSKSPLIHNAAFRKLRLDAVYLPLRVPADQLLMTLEEYRRLGLCGYSVTIPHKEAVLEFCDSLDEQTDEIGAANTLYLEGDEWVATNTDADAALQAIRMGLQRSPAKTTDLAGRRVMILGAGGVARAIAHVLVREGAAVTITNRSRERGKQLSVELQCQFVSWENRGVEACEILVNCTSVGMYPKMNETPYQANWLHESMLVFDTVYTPEKTLLLKQSMERGCTIVSGIEMFIRQAAMQFELFSDETAPTEFMGETLRRIMSAARVASSVVSSSESETDDEDDEETSDQDDT
ncbi:MAG: shikimate dehydrogenase [Planctomycetaceae bacterium]